MKEAISLYAKMNEKAQKLLRESTKVIKRKH